MMNVSFKKVIVGTMIAGALFSAGSAFAEDATRSDALPGATVRASKTLDIACMATAVAKRETAVSTAFGAKSTAISAALSKRATDLAFSWKISVAKDRNTAIKAVWKAFGASVKDAQKAYRTANAAAWKAFRTDAKACKGSPSQDAAAQGTDNNL